MDRAHDQPIADTISHDLHGLLHAITIMPHARANGGNGRAEPLTLHADETPVQMLSPGKGKTHRAYLWAYTSTQFSDLRAVVYDFAGLAPA